MENNDKENKKDQASFNLFGLGSLFKGVEKLVDLAGKLEQDEIINKEGEISFDNLKKGMKGVYGVTIRTAVGGSPKVETFGNIKKTPEGPVVDDEREPITDIFNEQEELVIIMEMPGIDQKDVKINLKDDILEVSATNKNRKYKKEILLPCKVLDTGLTSKYNNGILEINIKK